MHRRILLNLLNTYLKNYPQETDLCSRFIEFVQSHSDCFERSLECGHVTGSAWILNRGGDKFLLTHHKKIDAWLQLGGHADGEIDIHKVALAEAVEESGLAELVFVSRDILDLDIHEIPARKDTPAHFHYDVRFLLQATGDQNFKISDESHDLVWVSQDELSTFSHEPGLHRMAEKAKRLWQNRSF